MADSPDLNPNVPEHWPAIEQVIAELAKAKARQYGLDPADLRQEAALRIYRGRTAFDPARPFRPWCATIVHNTAMDLARKRQRSIRTTDLGALDPAGRPAPDASPPDVAMAREEPALWSPRQLELAADLHRQSPEAAVILFASEGWYLRLPDRMWRRWLAKLGWDTDFPDNAILESADPEAAMFAALAQQLQIQPDSVRRRRDRYRRDYRGWLAEFLGEAL